MKALSLFNGISALHLALDKAGIEVDRVYYAEIDKYANKVTEKHYPDDIALGDVTKWREWNIDWASIGLVGAGFPCQAWSVAGKQLGDKDERGMLFWTTLEIIAHVLKHNPSAKFLMENVKMKKDFEQYITHHTEQALGHVEKTLINSALVSAQNRQRYYWTNFEVTQPDDKGILLKDIIENDYVDRDKSYCIDANYHKGGNLDQYFNKSRRQLVFKNAEIKCGGQGNRIYSVNGKSPTLSSQSGGTAGSGSHLIGELASYRKLTPIECERLQTFPDIKKSVIINATKNPGEREWFLDCQRQNVNAETTCRKLQSNALIAEEKESSQFASAAMSCLNINQADQEMHAQKNVHIILGEDQLQLSYQGKSLLNVNVAELLKKQVHPTLEENIAQEIAGINLILEKTLLNGKGESQAKVKNSTHQNDGKKNVEKYGKEITHHAKDVESSVGLAQTDTFITSDHGQNSKTLDLNLQILFCYVLNVIDSFTQEEIQNENSLEIKIDYSCGFTAMISNTQRYKSLGNAWTVDVIVHILKCAFN